MLLQQCTTNTFSHEAHILHKTYEGILLLSFFIKTTHRGCLCFSPPRPFPSHNHTAIFFLLHLYDPFIFLFGGLHYCVDIGIHIKLSFFFLCLSLLAYLELLSVAINVLKYTNFYRVIMHDVGIYICIIFRTLAS